MEWVAELIAINVSRQTEEVPIVALSESRG